MAGDKDSHSRPSQALAGWRFASGYTGFYGSAGRGVFSCKQEAAENCRKPPDGLGRGGSGHGRGTALPRVSGEMGGAWAGPSPPERLAGLCTAPPGSPPRPQLRGPPAKGTVPGMAIPPTPWARQDSPGPHQGRERGRAGRGRALPAPLFAVAVKGTRAGAHKLPGKAAFATPFTASLSRRNPVLLELRLRWKRMPVVGSFPRLSGDPCSQSMDETTLGLLEPSRREQRVPVRALEVRGPASRWGRVRRRLGSPLTPWGACYRVH